MPRLASYPMHLREAVTPVRPGYLKEYAARVKGRTFKSRTREEDLEEMRKRWGITPVSSSDQKNSADDATSPEGND